MRVWSPSISAIASLALMASSTRTREGTRAGARTERMLRGRIRRRPARSPSAAAVPRPFAAHARTRTSARARRACTNAAAPSRPMATRNPTDEYGTMSLNLVSVELREKRERHRGDRQQLRAVVTEPREPPAASRWRALPNRCCAVRLRSPVRRCCRDRARLYGSQPERCHGARQRRDAMRSAVEPASSAGTSRCWSSQRRK